MHSELADLQADDPRVIRAMEEYASAVEAGILVDREEFLERHGDLRDALSGCLDGLQFLLAARKQLDGRF
jgi:hypothetical protein